MHNQITSATTELKNPSTFPKIT